MSKRKIYIFDTTLRDGEQAPGCSLAPAEKREVARQLAKLAVDIIEAGFPAASPGEIEAMQMISREVTQPVICGLARMVRKDIDAVKEALRFAKRRRLHVFLATSEIHRQYKLRKEKSEILQMVQDTIRWARADFDDIEFSPEDASRTELDFLLAAVQAAIAAGATTVNIPDTVGYAIPQEFGERIAFLVANCPEFAKGEAHLSVHCHNDLGLAVANSLAAVRAGADQVECTVNGLGERAGNAAMEEIVMAIKTRADLFGGAYTDVRTEEITKASRIVSLLTGMPVQPNKAIVGANAFRHESGIHQDGILKKRQTYEIIDPVSVGSGGTLVLGKHSGRHAFRERLETLGYRLSDGALERVFERFKRLADVKKEVFDADLEMLVEEEVTEVPSTWALAGFKTQVETGKPARASVRLRKGGKSYKGESTGDGPVDACFKALEKVTRQGARLADYGIRSVTAGKDAQGEVSLSLEVEGRAYRGRGSSTDIIEASVKAYLYALNKALGPASGRKVVSNP